MNILVATEKPFAKVAVEQIRKVVEDSGFKLLVLENYKSQDDLLKAVSQANALIVRSDLVTDTVVEAARNLKIVVRAGAGYDNIDIDSCTSHNIVVMNTPGQNSNAVAELAFGMMLYMVRHSFSGKNGTELREKNIGLHAFGNVGRYMAEIAKGFGMQVFAFDPFIDDDKIRSAGIRTCRTVEELYTTCQYISLHLPLINDTIGSVGYDLLKRMPDNAVLINAARKEIIDEEDLLKVFGEREDFKYLSDIVPDCITQLEEKYKGRYLFTAKKMGAQTEEANTKAGIAAVRQIVDYFATGNEKYRVNK